MMDVIEVRDATKRYDSLAVLNNLSMSVKRGSIYALMGSSGCGKTTLLSCIMGIKALDSGSIKVLCDSVGNNKRKVGFMPQNTSLIEEFTIKEIFNFFGEVYGLEQFERRERFGFLSNLLDLPSTNELIRNFSGGQKRRVSLALCMIHQPELLILDEPCVGLDPILRHNIWNFLKTLTQSSQTSIIITTHYIDEARQADCVGLLRNGVIIAEDSPVILLEAFNTSRLEKVFLMLCEGKTVGVVKTLPSSDILPEKQSKAGSPNVPEAKLLKLKALMTKNLIQTLRRPAALSFMLLCPFICLMSFYLTIGTNPVGLKIGIVNEEITNLTECDNPLLKMTTVIDYTCRVNKISCRFINSLNESIASKHFYRTISDAREDVKRGNIIGLIHFASNFTSLMRPLNELQGFLENYTSNGEIQVFLDQSDQQISYFLKRKLYQTFEEFVETLMLDCGKSRRVASSPIQFNAMYGSLNDEVRKSMAPGIIVTMYFFLASMITSTAFISDRLDGIWNRILLAGVRPMEILVSHIITSSFIMILQILECFVVTKYFFNLENQGDMPTQLLLIFLVGFSAILYGLAVSILAKDFMTATFLSTLMFYPMVIMCGIFWPLEAIPWYFRYVAYCLPFTLPTVALRNIMYKGFTLANFSVQLGFSIISSWILLSLAVCFFGLKSRKFCAN